MYYRNLTETINIINIPQVLHFKCKVYFKTSLTPTCESVNLSVLGAGAGAGAGVVAVACLWQDVQWADIDAMFKQYVFTCDRDLSWGVGGGI